MFPAWRIALTALVTAVITAVITAAGASGLAGWRRRTSGRASAWWSLFTWGDGMGVGVAAGLGVLLWRLGANVPILNADPIPGVSPADVLSAPLAYVATSIYVRLRTAEAADQLAAAPAVAALVALFINIVTI
jgi:hypothetical protein